MEFPVLAVWQSPSALNLPRCSNRWAYIAVLPSRLPVDRIWVRLHLPDYSWRPNRANSYPRAYQDPEQSLELQEVAAMWSSGKRREKYKNRRCVRTTRTQSEPVN